MKSLIFFLKGIFNLKIFMIVIILPIAAYSEANKVPYQTQINGGDPTPISKDSFKAIPPAAEAKLITSQTDTNGYRTGQEPVLTSTTETPTKTSPAPQGPAPSVPSTTPSTTMMTTCDNWPGSSYNFTKFEESKKDLETAYQKYAMSCNQSALDGKLGTAKAGDLAETSSGMAENSSILGFNTTGIAATFSGRCNELEEEYDKAFKKAESALAQDKAACQKQAEAVGNTITKPATTALNCTMRTSINKNICDKKMEEYKIGTLETVSNWVGNNKMLVGGALAAVGYGVSQLMDSGDTMRDENRSTGGATTVTKSETSNADATTASKPSHQSCEDSLKPLECFVTPQCSLQCVAGNFGLPNYAGQGADFNRIDANGKVVNTDPSAALSAGGGSNDSTQNLVSQGGGSGGTAASAATPIQTVAGATPVTPGMDTALKNQMAEFSGFDITGGMGGYESGGFSDSLEVSNAISAGNRNVAGASPAPNLTKTQIYQQAIASGPIRPSSAGGSLFDSIQLVTGRLGVRSMVLP